MEAHVGNCENVPLAIDVLSPLIQIPDKVENTPSQTGTVSFVAPSTGQKVVISFEEENLKEMDDELNCLFA